MRTIALNRLICTSCLFVIVIPIVLPGCMYIRGNDITTTTTSAKTSGGNWIIQWGESKGKLIFIAFAKSSENNPESITKGVSSTREPDYAVITNPVNGTEIKVTGPSKVFHYIDGKFYQSPLEVSLEQFKEFMASNPDTYTAEEIRDYLNSR